MVRSRPRWRAARRRSRIDRPSECPFRACRRNTRDRRSERAEPGRGVTRRCRVNTWSMAGAAGKIALRVRSFGVSGRRGACAGRFPEHFRRNLSGDGPCASCRVDLRRANPDPFGLRFRTGSEVDGPRTPVGMPPLADRTQHPLTIFPHSDARGAVPHSTSPLRIRLLARSTIRVDARRRKPGSPFPNFRPDGEADCGAFVTLPSHSAPAPGSRCQTRNRTPGPAKERRRFPNVHHSIV